MKRSDIYTFNKFAQGRLGVLACLACVSGYASGGKPPIPPPNPAGPPEIRVLNETQPAGGTVQLKFVLTEPKPISSGTDGTSLDSSVFDSFDGIQLFSDTGDVFGTATVDNGYVRVRYLSPNGTFGTNADYPLLTIAAHIGSNAPRGQKTTVGFDASSFWNNAIGQSNGFASTPGTLTVGGSVSISNVIPGGGTWPGGTVIRILGSGFLPNTSLQLAGAKSGKVKVIGPNEIDVIPAENIVMDGQRIDAKNPDGSTDTYYSYMRGIPQGQSAEPLLVSTVPIFSTIAHSQAALQQQAPGLTNNVITALAIQNPNANAAQIEMQALDPFGQQIGYATLTLPFGARITRTLGEYFGLTLAPGSTVRISASQVVQMLGIAADKTTSVVLPFSPAFQ